MQFTEKELEFAREMKEMGLEWAYPVEGDWFIAANGNTAWVCLGIGMTTEVIHFHNGYADHSWQAICNMEKGDTIWLPLWCQCRDIIANEGWHIVGFIDTPPQVEWRVHINLERQIDEETHCIEATGETDLEAMYKAIIAIKTRNKIIK